MKQVVVLGCAGSIGVQALSVIRCHPEQWRVLALHTGSQAHVLLEQVQEFAPRYVGLSDRAAADRLKEHLPKEIQLEAGQDAACNLAALPDADVVVLGISGIAGLPPLLAALKAGKTVALANKESIVCGHQLVQEALNGFGGRILPVDSEQSAIFQCLSFGERTDVKSLILTASGGPFRSFSKQELAQVTPQQALRHPTWNMGKTITIDSATLFNKGLEIMEASYLFEVPGNRIRVMVHPQSVVHSMVEFMDGAVAAQLSVPDMRLAIQYALSYPQRLPGTWEGLTAARMAQLNFEEPDHARFPALTLAYAALEEGCILPIVYQGANAAAVKMFLNGEAGFLDIPNCVEYAMGHIRCERPSSLEGILAISQEAERLAHIALGR